MMAVISCVRFALRADGSADSNAYSGSNEDAYSSAPCFCGEKVSSVTSIFLDAIQCIELLLHKIQCRIQRLDQ